MALGRAGGGHSIFVDLWVFLGAKRIRVGHNQIIRTRIRLEGGDKGGVAKARMGQGKEEHQGKGTQHPQGGETPREVEKDSKHKGVKHKSRFNNRS